MSPTTLELVAEIAPTRPRHTIDHWNITIWRQGITWRWWVAAVTTDGVSDTGKPEACPLAFTYGGALRRAMRQVEHEARPTIRLRT